VVVEAARRLAARDRQGLAGTKDHRQVVSRRNNTPSGPLLLAMLIRTQARKSNRNLLVTALLLAALGSAGALLVSSGGFPLPLTTGLLGTAALLLTAAMAGMRWPRCNLILRRLAAFGPPEQLAAGAGEWVEVDVHCRNEACGLLVEAGGGPVEAEGFVAVSDAVSGVLVWVRHLSDSEAFTAVSVENGEVVAVAEEYPFRNVFQIPLGEPQMLRVQSQSQAVPGAAADGGS